MFGILCCVLFHPAVTRVDTYEVSEDGTAKASSISSRQVIEDHITQLHHHGFHVQQLRSLLQTLISTHPFEDSKWQARALNSLNKGDLPFTSFVQEIPPELLGSVEVTLVRRRVVCVNHLYHCVSATIACADSRSDAVPRGTRHYDSHTA